MECEHCNKRFPDNLNGLAEMTFHCVVFHGK
jgi:hypothetical protein